MNEAELWRQIETIISRDPGSRGIVHLLRPGDLEHACRKLEATSEVVIITGFLIPSAGVCETDGPPGAMALASGLTRLGTSVEILTDRWCEQTLSQLFGRVHVWPDRPENESPGARCWVSIERLGRAADQKYYNMRGVDQSATTAPIDSIFLSECDSTSFTIGVGDGGNEIGMGLVRDQVVKHIPNGERIASIVPADALITAGVSNWGAWGLLAGLSILARRNLLPTANEALSHLQQTVEAGAVDGVTSCNEFTVDGLAWEIHEGILSDLHGVLR
jgi:hypothetical protein